MSPVELLRSAAEVLRRTPEYWPRPVHKAVAAPLAVLLEAEAARLERLIPQWSDSERGLAWNDPSVLTALIDGLFGRSLAVARGVLGVSDGV